ncbi:alcohol dehydrogenase [Mycobacterium sp. 852002-51163_SCH5372311]|uniref:NADP-dependent oxidoreductase n=1 Tax=Mycobacterium sp. 852002-51163_SCH5372311 TaxID=1834097 RepID=UPI00080118E5|nr:NADP-dependent oxidoreductase [Mycobacterium sp. 852002-51163_SCH5372311]OBF91065.1 alcohol dehydrogenase [Mycobacterium sp. 852002-51163_SCH5372311]
MKAVRLHARGGPEQLRYEDAPTPAPTAGEVRVRVQAAGITPTELTWTETYQDRSGNSRLPSIPAHELCGVVDAVGTDVDDIALGDVLYGLIDFPRDGCAAEFVVAPAADLAPAPQTLDPVQVAAVPLSGLTAWQALFRHGRLQGGQRVLIHGAAGGVGSLAVQLARWKRARIIATASQRHESFLRELGVDQFIDYTAESFETAVGDVDLVLDTVGGETLNRSWAVLKTSGRLISIVEEPGPPPAGHAPGMFFIVEPSRPELGELTRLIDAGELRPLVQSVFPLARARAAFEEGFAGHLRGKIVLRVE